MQNTGVEKKQNDPQMSDFCRCLILVVSSCEFAGTDISSNIYIYIYSYILVCRKTTVVDCLCSDQRLGLETRGQS